MPIIEYLVCFQYFTMKKQQWTLLVVSFGHAFNITIARSGIVPFEASGLKGCCRKANSSPGGCSNSLLASEWLARPPPLAPPLFSPGSCCASLQGSWWVGGHCGAPCPKRMAREPGPGGSSQCDLSLGGFLSRSGKAPVPEVEHEWPHVFLWLLPPAHGRDPTCLEAACAWWSSLCLWAQLSSVSAWPPSLSLFLGFAEQHLSPCVQLAVVICGPGPAGKPSLTHCGYKKTEGRVAFRPLPPLSVLATYTCQVFAGFLLHVLWGHMVISGWWRKVNSWCHFHFILLCSFMILTLSCQSVSFQNQCFFFQIYFGIPLSEL